jgi:hypothetical protein
MVAYPDITRVLSSVELAVTRSEQSMSDSAGITGQKSESTLKSCS